MKTASRLNKEIRKKEFLNTELGRVQLALKRFYGDPKNQEKFNAESSDWVNNHRTQAVLKQEALEKKYAEDMDTLLAEQMQIELDYLNTL